MHCISTTRIAESVRAILGLVYVGGAFAHLAFWATNRDMYAEITPHVQFEWYRDLWTGVVLPNVGVLLPLLALFEALVAVAILSNERVARAGLLAGAAFNVAIAPLGFWWPANVALAAIHLTLVPVTYRETTVGRMRSRLASARAR
ncbi:MAG: hypothetical protein V5A21_03045 [Halapricum sp.]